MKPFGSKITLPGPPTLIHETGVFKLGWPAQKFDFSEKSNFFNSQPIINTPK